MTTASSTIILNPLSLCNKWPFTCFAPDMEHKHLKAQSCNRTNNAVLYCRSSGCGNARATQRAMPGITEERRASARGKAKSSHRRALWVTRRGKWAACSRGWPEGGVTLKAILCKQLEWSRKANQTRPLILGSRWEWRVLERKLSAGGT